MRPFFVNYLIPVPASTQFDDVRMGRDTQTYDDGPLRSDDD